MKALYAIVVCAALIYAGWRFLNYLALRSLEQMLGGAMLSGPPSKPRAPGWDANGAPVEDDTQ